MILISLRERERELYAVQGEDPSTSQAAQPLLNEEDDIFDDDDDELDIAELEELEASITKTSLDDT